MTMAKCHHNRAHPPKSLSSLLQLQLKACRNISSASGYHQATDISPFKRQVLFPSRSKVIRQSGRASNLQVLALDPIICFKRSFSTTTAHCECDDKSSWRKSTRPVPHANQTGPALRGAQVADLRNALQQAKLYRHQFTPRPPVSSTDGPSVSMPHAHISRISTARVRIPRESSRRVSLGLDAVNSSARYMGKTWD